MKTKVMVMSLMITLLLTGVCAANETEEEVLNKLFTYDEDNIGDLFSKSFLEKIPVPKVVEVVKGCKSQLGSLKKVKNEQKGYNLIFEKGNAQVYLSLNEDKKINYLEFGDFNKNNDNLVDIKQDFKSLDGKVSVTILKNNNELVWGYNEDDKMAVGSSFKLYVLKAVYDTINSSDKSWNDVILLNVEDISLPTGILQDWQPGTPVTIKTLTNLMIQISDNTATDHLINYVGKNAIEKMASEKNRPFLKTNELFKLKYLASSEIQTAYIEGAIEERQKILQEIDDYDIGKISVNSNPTRINEIQWFFSTKELCNIIYALKDAGEIQINPGFAKGKKWYLAGYKGGSEPGVLQYTHILQKDKDDNIYTVSVTINNPDKKVNKSKFNELTNRLILLVKKGNI